ncbi:uncharacterized protein CLUP02_00692 [Colletotrichum lupini]|uniref:Uncharacterized protein n=1 Tax=Colletotrichum lupini TaxID=145971 RepID=A0A9Q8W974_9PEZI|nr:uncharacterized protein CLUP02_00692 [Colletotrichum lupini]UQC74045.1 hypothetical protein CLUP02_00692 [Colletotrichum lupini]
MLQEEANREVSAYNDVAVLIGYTAAGDHSVAELGERQCVLLGFINIFMSLLKHMNWITELPPLQEKRDQTTFLVWPFRMFFFVGALGSVQQVMIVCVSTLGGCFFQASPRPTSAGRHREPWDPVEVRLSGVEAFLESAGGRCLAKQSCLLFFGQQDAESHCVNEDKSNETIRHSVNPRPATTPIDKKTSPNLAGGLVGFSASRCPSFGAICPAKALTSPAPHLA